MPEFRLRRKKDKNKEQQPRRHTVHNDSEMAVQLQEMAMLFQQSEIIFGPNEVSVDDAVERRRQPIRNLEAGEMFVSLSSSEPSVKAPTDRKIPSKYSECLFLRHGADMRRCPMPSPITLSTIKQLFINLFDLNPTISKDPSWHLFILDRSNTWKPLDTISLIHDHCTLLLVDSSDLGSMVASPSLYDHLISRSSTGTPDEQSSPDNECRSTTPTTHRDEPRNLSPEQERLEGQQDQDGSLNILSTSLPSLTSQLPSSSTGIFLTPPSLPLPRRPSLVPQTLYQSVRQLRSDLVTLKNEHQQKMAQLQMELSITKHRIKTAIQDVSMDPVPSFRQERLAITPLKEEYMRQSEAIFNEIRVLQSIGEGLRVDAVDRRCKINSEEVNTLLSMVNESATTITNLKGQFGPLEEKLKTIMKDELHVIVTEERLIEEEAEKLEKADESCRNLINTLITLQQVSLFQSQRSPHIPIFSTVDESNKLALIQSINAISPDHLKRMESIEMAETVIEKKKQFSPNARALRKFELALQQGHDQLKTTGNDLNALDREIEEKAKSMYMDEKLERQKQIEKEIALAEKLLNEKRQKEIAEIEQRLQSVNAIHKSKEQEQMRQLEEERRRLDEERQRQEQERQRLNELWQQQEQEHCRLRDEKRRQEEEKWQLEYEKQQQEIAKKKIEEDRKKWEEFHSKLDSDSPDVRARHKELLWQHIQQQVQSELENERLQKQRQQRSHQRTLQDNTLVIDKNLSQSSGSGLHVSHFRELENAPMISSLMFPQAQNSSSHRDLRRRESPQSAETSRRLVPTHSNEIRRPFPDTLQKFNSEDSLVKQNLYDHPWTSKQLLLVPPSNRRGTTGSMLANHRRHKSDVHETPPMIPKHNGVDHREYQTPSPKFLQSNGRPPIQGKSLSLSRDPPMSQSGPIRVRDDERNHQSSYFLSRHTPPNSTRVSPPIVRGYSPPTLKHNGLNNGVIPLPSYSQALTVSYPAYHSSNGMHQRSNALEPRLTHYPLSTTGPEKQKHSISYV